MTPSLYRGRFAPSPTGPLHFGSLVTAVASYADARSHDGEWLLRIEDIDEARRRSGAEQQILQGLEAYGMHWDGPVLRQSARKDRYAEALGHLRAQGVAYRCNCSRKMIATMARVGSEGPVYPGTCRARPPTANTSRVAWRVAVGDEAVSVQDRIVGAVDQDLGRELGDFVVYRMDGFTAYQLAVVVDDHEQRITDIVRGADLLWSTPRQVWLQRRLGYATPRYAHIPLVYAADGHKLSKSTQAFPIDVSRPMVGLRAAWAHLGQLTPPEELIHSESFWRWAGEHWDIDRVPLDRNIRHEQSLSL